MKKNFKKALAVFVLTIAVISVAGVFVNNFTKTEEAVQVVSEKVLVPGGQSVGKRGGRSDYCGRRPLCLQSRTPR